MMVVDQLVIYELDCLFLKRPLFTEEIFIFFVLSCCKLLIPTFHKLKSPLDQDF